MNCVNPACDAEALYLRSSGISAVGWMGGWGSRGECQAIQRKLIWLWDGSEGEFVVESWRPPGEQVRPIRSRSPHSRASARGDAAEIWS